jgi:hypothetical protein
MREQNIFEAVASKKSQLFLATQAKKCSPCLVLTVLHVHGHCCLWGLRASTTIQGARKLEPNETLNHV